MARIPKKSLESGSTIKIQISSRHFNNGKKYDFNSPKLVKPKRNSREDLRKSPNFMLVQNTVYPMSFRASKNSNYLKIENNDDSSHTYKHDPYQDLN